MLLNHEWLRLGALRKNAMSFLVDFFLWLEEAQQLVKKHYEQGGELSCGAINTSAIANKWQAN